MPIHLKAYIQIRLHLEVSMYDLTAILYLVHTGTGDSQGLKSFQLSVPWVLAWTQSFQPPVPWELARTQSYQLLVPWGLAKTKTFQLRVPHKLPRTVISSSSTRGTREDSSHFSVHYARDSCGLSHFSVQYPRDSRELSHFNFQCSWDSRGLSFQVSVP